MAQYRLLVTSDCALFGWAQTRPAFGQVTLAKWLLLKFKIDIHIYQDETGADQHSNLDTLN